MAREKQHHRCACGAPISPKAARCTECAKPIRAAKIRDRARRKRPVPADFAIVAKGKGIDKICRHYGTGPSVVKRWLQESAVDRGPLAAHGWACRPAPDGFALSAARMSLAQLAARYEVSKTIITRWVRETGAKPRQQSQFFPSNSHNRPFQPHRDVSREGQAAAYLQRFGPVFRSDAQGNPNPKGTHWRRSSFVLTTAELIDRAVRNGWDENAWRKIA
ncbi:hypothetical protein DAH66_12775 [Sphingomonas koreensis]|uniref:Uncharacterized protein n=1 Tax=Sphingomonas koreensis TaxID=93064 RepID=A0A430G2D2_9SPHN|nr:hypothetical protein [Sphingomonas koreensis]RSY83137.1 hypothetical protein DAH66_12775 [Sphingomonas koreensis]